MSDRLDRQHGTMEGAGAYNRQSGRQASGVSAALPLIGQAAQLIAIGSGDNPIVMVDYGCSQGRNSLLPMHNAVDVVRHRVGSGRAILVVHTDLPANDFTALFDVLTNDPASYLKGDEALFSAAVGRSFYEPVLPANYVSLGWSSYAVMWLSGRPVTISDHFFAPCSSPEVRKAFAEQAARDWETFLSLRSVELRRGGRLVVVTAALQGDGSSPLLRLMDHANQALCGMVKEGLVTTNEYKEMSLANYTRQEKDLAAPFASGTFADLAIEHCEIVRVPDPAWDAYQRHNDVALLANAHAGFFRTTFAPTLAAGLDNDRGAGAKIKFATEIEARLRDRLMADPAPVDSIVGVIMLAKQ